MIYGVEQTTDLRYPETKIEKFSSRSAAIAWAQEGGQFAWAGGARSDIPASQQNWHKRIRDIFEMPAGWRPPSAKARREWVSRNTSPTYRRNVSDALAHFVQVDGERIDVPEPVRA